MHERIHRPRGERLTMRHGIGNLPSTQPGKEKDRRMDKSLNARIVELAGMGQMGVT